MGNDARTALALGACLLLIAALLRGADRLASATPATHAGPDGGLSILATSQGHLLPPARLPGGGETLDDAILIGDLILKLDERPEGLRVATLGPGLVHDSLRCFDLARSAEDASSLLEHCRGAPVGSLLVLAGHGRFAPTTPETNARTPELVALLAELGAETDPLGDAPSSWTMITVRRPAGWVKLAEAFARDQGAALAFTVHPDLSVYDGHRGEVLVTRLSGEAAVPLQLALAAAETTAGVRRSRWTSVGGEKRDSIAAPPPFEDGARGPSSVRWSGVRPTEGARFRTGIALGDGAWTAAQPSDGATFELLVDGEVLRSETLRPESAPYGWIDWEVPLADHAGREVELELRVDPRGDSFSDWALWGAPALVQVGAPGPPRKVPLWDLLLAAMLAPPQARAAEAPPAPGEPEGVAAEPPARDG